MAAEETTVATETTVESGPTTQEVHDAKAIGWVDKGDFRGDPAKWIDAREYLQRGRDFIPFLRASNKKLEEKLSHAESLLRANQMALEEVRSTQQNIVKADTAQEVKDLRAQVVQLMKDGEFERAEEVRERIAELRSPPARPTQPTTANAIEQTPEFQAFVRDNPWWHDDPAMRAASVAIAQQMAANREITDEMPASERYAKIAEATRARFDSGRRFAPSRVESSRQTPTRSSTGKEYSDLPPDAKEACESQARWLVGETKKFKDLASWQKSYAAKYFEGT